MSERKLEKTVFFDRDGVVNFRIVKEYVRTRNQFHFIQDFIPFFTHIKRAGYGAILITNQQGVGKGLMTLEEINAVHNHMQQLLLEQTGYQFDDIFLCTDLATSNSFYRKPNPGMLLDAIAKWGIDPQQSLMIGDRSSDVIAGRRAGVSTILISNRTEIVPEADYKFNNLEEALPLFK